MKQIIVSLHWLSVEQKQRVNEALAKITGATKLPDSKIGDGWLFATPALDGMMITSDWLLSYGEPTHTPEELLEMAGMTEKRKVRKDFEPRKEYCVDVSNCTEYEKKKVQQAFFDVGVHWAHNLKQGEYGHLDALQYTNSCGVTFKRLQWAYHTKGCNMTPAEFFEAIYEPEQQGHPHASLMAEYAQDAKFTDEPWKLWQVREFRGDWEMRPHFWVDCHENPMWVHNAEYRRKPKTKIVNGTSVPDISFIPKQGENYYFPDIDLPELYDDDYYDHSFFRDEMRVEGNRCYPYTEEWKRASILHSRALLGLAD